MHIKSITLDGFKSYGNRVEITGFDPAFNAITGLNGTGKSNILDSICFVLGITNLSNVSYGVTELRHPMLFMIYSIQSRTGSQLNQVKCFFMKQVLHRKDSLFNMGTYNMFQENPYLIVGSLSNFVLFEFD